MHLNASITESAPVHVVDSGEADLPVLVCLHSLAFDHRMFDALASHVHGRFRVVRIDFRSHGQSPRAHAYVSIDQCADDVLAVLEHLEIERCQLVAQSMGGDVALRIAIRRPALVGSMVLIGSSAGAEDPANRRPFTMLARIIRRLGVKPVAGQTMKIMFGDTFRNDPNRSAIRTLWKQRLAANDKSIHWVVRGVIDRASVVAELETITAPALVLSGDEDTARPTAWSRQMADLLPDSRLQVLHGVGHSPTIEVPDLVGTIITDFCMEYQS